MESNLKYSLLFSFLIFITSTAFSQTIAIDTAISHQTIQGWEAGTGTLVIEGESIYSDTTLPYIREDLAKLMVDSLGINRVRLEVRSGSENPVDYYDEHFISENIPYEEWRANRYATVNDNDDPNDLDMSKFHFTELAIKIRNAVLPLKKLLEEKGESLYVNLCYVAFTGQITDGEFHHRDPQEYAELILAVFKHMDETYGFYPDGVEVILEPGVADFGNGKLVGECMVATGDKLKANGYTPEFIALSNTNLFGANNSNMIGKFLEVPRVLDYWSEQSYHCYAGRTDDNLKQVADRAKEYGIRTSMLEWWTNGNTYERLHTDLTIGNNSAFQFRFSLTSPNETSGLSHTIFNSPDDYTIELNEYVKYVQPYFKNIKRGAIRKEATSDSEILNPAIFKNPDGNLVLIVTSTEESAITIQNLPAGTYDISYTTGDGRREPKAYNEYLPTQAISSGEDLTANIPDKGFMVIKQVESETTSVNSSNSELLKVYPNPATSNISIESENIIESITIVDTEGRVVYNSDNLQVFDISIDVSNFTTGNYTIMITDSNEKNKTRKLVIVK
jgi:hypothetical protein